VAGQQRSANVETSLVQIPGEISKRLRCVAEAVQKKNGPGIAGAQVDRTCAWDYVCYWSSGGTRVTADR
jgi:hypothetical protein